MAHLTGRFIVEDWNTEEIIIEFQTNEERAAWIAENVNDEGKMADGRKVSIYDII